MSVLVVFSALALSSCARVRLGTAWTAAKVFPPSRPRMVSALIDGLDDPDPHVRRRACDYLGSIGPGAPEAIPKLIGRLDDHDMFVALSAGLALGEMGPEAVPPLIESLQHEYANVCALAAQALRDIGLPAAAPAVTPLMNVLARSKPDAMGLSCRWAAAKALAGMGPLAKPAVPLLMDALKDPESVTRQWAAIALGNLGPDARDALPALEQATQDTNALVRARAQEAIRRIRAAGEAEGKVPRSEVAAPEQLRLDRTRGRLERAAAVPAVTSQ